MMRLNEMKRCSVICFGSVPGWRMNKDTEKVVIEVLSTLERAQASQCFISTFTCLQDDK